MKKIIYLIILIVSITNFGNTAEVTTQEFLKGCKNYYLWVNKNYEIPVDEKILFNMGKRQGVIETMGKVMLTLCYESKRNLSISSLSLMTLNHILMTFNAIQATLDSCACFRNFISAEGRLRPGAGINQVKNFPKLVEKMS